MSDLDDLSQETEDNGARKGDRIGVENLRVLENISVEMTVEVGRTEITIRDLLRLNEGSVIELDRLAGDPLDIRVNV
jgi:flagellar motor switch protein FliN/FliY